MNYELQISGGFRFKFLICFQLIIFFFCSQKLIGQSITVSATEKIKVEVDKYEATAIISEKESTLSANKVNSRFKSKNEILAKLETGKIDFELINQEIDSLEFLDRSQNQHLRVSSMYYYRLKIENEKELTTLRRLSSEIKNLSVMNYTSSNTPQENKMKALVEKVCKKARKEADIIASALNRKTGTILNLKVDKSKPFKKLPVRASRPKDFKKEDSLTLEVTFETIEK